MLLAGIGVGAQMRTALSLHRHLQILPVQLEELAYQLHHHEQEVSALESEVVMLRTRLAEYQTAASTRQASLRMIAGELERLKTLAGLVPVEGPGVTVEMEDSRRPLRPREDPNEVILHNYDVVGVVNDLWEAGAEAIAVNGQRVIATTAIRSAATTMMVNARRITPPLRIEAIGDPARLAHYLLRPDGYVTVLRAFTFPVEIRVAHRLILPPYKGPLQFRYLRPATVN